MIGSIDVLEVPDDAPHTVSVQRLNGRALERARQASQLAAMKAVKRLGGAQFQRELAGIGDPTVVAELVAKQLADPLNGVDRYVVLYKGIKAWTYPEPLTWVEVVDDDGDKEMRIPAIDDQFTAEQVEYLARAIMARTVPARDAAGKKTAPESSIAP